MKNTSNIQMALFSGLLSAVWAAPRASVELNVLASCLWLGLALVYVWKASKE